MIYSTHLVGLLVHGLHHNHVSGLVDPVDWRLQLHSVSQLPRHALTHLIRTPYKLPLLETQREQSSVSTNRESRCSNTGFYLYWVEVTLIPLWVPLSKANKLPVWNEADKIPWFILVMHTGYPQSAFISFTTNFCILIQKKHVHKARPANVKWWRWQWGGREVWAVKAPIHKTKSVLTISMWLVSTSLSPLTRNTLCAFLCGIWMNLSSSRWESTSYT